MRKEGVPPHSPICYAYPFSSQLVPSHGTISLTLFPLGGGRTSVLHRPAYFLHRGLTCRPRDRSKTLLVRRRTFSGPLIPQRASHCTATPLLRRRASGGLLIPQRALHRTASPLTRRRAVSGPLITQRGPRCTAAPLSQCHAFGRLFVPQRAPYSTAALLSAPRLQQSIDPSAGVLLYHSAALATPRLE